MLREMNASLFGFHCRNIHETLTENEHFDIWYRMTWGIKQKQKMKR